MSLDYHSDLCEVIDYRVYQHIVTGRAWYDHSTPPPVIVLRGRGERWHIHIDSIHTHLCAQLKVHHGACVVTVVVLDWLLSCRQSGKSNSIICLVSCFLSLSFSLWRAQRCLLPWCTFSCAQRCVCMLSMCICHLSPLPLRTITGGGVLWSYQALPVTMCWYTL